jgi:hypothetical protein
MLPSRLLWLGILIGVLGALIGIALSSPQTDALAPNPPPPAGVTGGGEGIPPDPRWLDLVRAASAAPALRAPATCDFATCDHATLLPATLLSATLHVHLTDRTVAGRVPSPAPVSVRVERGARPRSPTATASRFPDGGGYLYLAVHPPWGSGIRAGCGYVRGCPVARWSRATSSGRPRAAPFISLTLPPFSVLGLTAHAGAVSGTAPPSETVALYLYPRAGTPRGADPDRQPPGPTAPTRPPGPTCAPAIAAYAVWNAAPNRAAYVRFVAPLPAGPGGRVRRSSELAPSLHRLLSGSPSPTGPGTTSSEASPGLGSGRLLPRIFLCSG